MNQSVSCYGRMVLEVLQNLSQMEGNQLHLWSQSTECFIKSVWNPQGLSMLPFAREFSWLLWKSRTHNYGHVPYFQCILCFAVGPCTFSFWPFFAPWMFKNVLALFVLSWHPLCGILGQPYQCRLWSWASGATISWQITRYCENFLSFSTSSFCFPHFRAATWSSANKFLKFYQVDVQALPDASFKFKVLGPWIH